MSELKLEYLAGYLPYDLKIANKSTTGEILSTYIVEIENINDRGILNVLHGVNQFPILKPLSTLTKIELRQAGFDSHIDFLTHENKGVEWTLRAPFKMIQYLFKNHYDVYFIIEQGLAIEL